jgi:hypothetical protein
VLVEAPRDAEVVGGEGVVVPPDRADDGDVAARRGERLRFEPLPADIARPAGEVLREDPVAVDPRRPQLVVAREQQAGPLEPEAAEALLQRVAVCGGGVADHQQHVPAGRVHAVDHLFSGLAGAGVVVVQVGRDEQAHRRDCTRDLRTGSPRRAGPCRSGRTEGPSPVHPSFARTGLTQPGSMSAPRAPKHSLKRAVAE